MYISESDKIMSKGLKHMAYSEDVRSDKLQIFAITACVVSIIASFFGGKAKGRADVYKTIANGFENGQLHETTIDSEGH